MNSNLKSRQLAALVEQQKVLVLRPGNHGKTVQLLFRELREGDAFCFEGNWSLVVRVVPDEHTLVIRPIEVAAPVRPPAAPPEVP